ncbi:hypothetical protein [Fusicatenibacter sp.]
MKLRRRGISGTREKEESLREKKHRVIARRAAAEAGKSLEQPPSPYREQPVKRLPHCWKNTA